MASLRSASENCRDEFIASNAAEEGKEAVVRGSVGWFLEGRE